MGEAIAQRALEAGVKQAAFDRREYKYHGRVAALADAARDAGLDLGAKAEKPVVEEKKPKDKGKGKERRRPRIRARSLLARRKRNNRLLKTVTFFPGVAAAKKATTQGGLQIIMAQAE